MKERPRRQAGCSQVPRPTCFWREVVNWEDLTIDDDDEDDVDDEDEEDDEDDDDKEEDVDDHIACCIPKVASCSASL